MWMRRCVVTGVLALSAGAVRADFTYQETTQITGGALVGMMKMAGAFSKQAKQAGEPVVSTVMIQGNRMARIGHDTTEIIDLDRETITQIDNVKHQYTVTTFAQMKQQIDAAMAKAKQEQAKSAPAAASGPSTTEMKFTAHVRQTGATKQVAGLQTDESILAMTVDATDKKSGATGGLAITNDMWLAPEVPGYGEVRDFYMRYAVKMGRVMGGAMNAQLLAMQPAAGQGMAEMVKEMSKLKGIPLLQVMRMGTTLNGQALAAASEAPLPTNTPAMPSVGDVAQQTAVAALASKLGGLGSLSGIGSGLGGFGRKKKADAAAAVNSTVDSTSDAASNAAAAKAVGGGQGNGGAAGSAATESAVLVESKTEMTGFSQATVDAGKFAVPAGFAKVEAKSME